MRVELESQKNDSELKMVLNANNAIEAYGSSVSRIARLYYGLYVANRQWTDVDISDLMQAGCMAVLNVERKRPEMLVHKTYVNAAIKYSIINEMRKMRHTVRQVYLAHLHEKEVPIVDVLPTRETASERLEQLDELLYQVRHEFSPADADALDSLVQKCTEVYDLNLSALPSTDTKDRVKVVTAMDLDDEEMIIYAQVLMGARGKFPNGWCCSSSSRRIAPKYFKALLEALEMDIKEFAQSRNQEELLRKYRLFSFVEQSYQLTISGLLLDCDPGINIEEINSRYKWGSISAKELIKVIQRLKKRVGKNPEEITKLDFEKNNLGGMLVKVFDHSPRLAIEFAYPRTYPQYQEKAMEIWRKYG